ncbi:MAG: hypothetical protein ACR2IF_05240 [Terriglobales bacterium]
MKRAKLGPLHPKRKDARLAVLRERARRSATAQIRRELLALPGRIAPELHRQPLAVIKQRLGAALVAVINNTGDADGRK